MCSFFDEVLIQRVSHLFASFLQCTSHTVSSLNQAARFNMYGTNCYGLINWNLFKEIG